MSFPCVEPDVQPGTCRPGQAGRGHQAGPDGPFLNHHSLPTPLQPGIRTPAGFPSARSGMKNGAQVFLATDQFQWASADPQPWGLRGNCSRLSQDTAPKKTQKNKIKSISAFHTIFVSVSLKIKYFPLFISWIYSTSLFDTKIAAFILLPCKWNTQEEIKQNSQCKNKVQLWLITS